MKKKKTDHLNIYCVDNVLNNSFQQDLYISTNFVHEMLLGKP